MLTFFRQFLEVQAVISERKDGSMKVFSERPEDNRENRKRFFEEQGILSDRVVNAGLVHGTNVEIITPHNVTDYRRSYFIGNNKKSGVNKMKGGVVLDTDGLVTREKNIFLSVTAADCLPVFFSDPIAGVVGIAHAGWRGIVLGVIGKTLEKMSECGAAKENVSVAIGPHIGVCHFEIQTDILPRFAQYEKYVIKKEGKSQSIANDVTRLFVDLEGIVKEQLRAAGIAKTHIETSPLCTFCESQTFFSYRRERSKEPQVMVATIGMQEKAP